MAHAKNDIVFNDLADPKLTFLQKLALGGARNVKIDFSQDSVLSAARETTGLNDFGKENFREALQVLLDDYKLDEELSGVGQQQVFKDLVRCASNHLIIQDKINNTPQLDRVTLKKPLSVSGLPRSGTTHLVNLLAADSRFMSLPLWVAQEPFHAPGKEKASAGLKFSARMLARLLKSSDSLTNDDPRYLRCSARWSGMQIMGPDLAAMHPMNPDHIHEELELMTFDFGSNQFEWTSMVPGYRWTIGPTALKPYCALVLGTEKSGGQSRAWMLCFMNLWQVTCKRSKRYMTCMAWNLREKLDKK